MTRYEKKYHFSEDGLTPLCDTELKQEFLFAVYCGSVDCKKCLSKMKKGMIHKTKNPFEKFM